MKRVAIVGGGIAGLSAAYYLEKARQQGAAFDWKLFEKSGRLGGVIRTEYRDGFILEAGPDSFVTMKHDAAQLCRDLGLGDQIIHSNDFQRKTYIVVKGRLVPIPDGLQFMVPTRILPMITTRLFSLRTKIRMMGEIFSPPRNQDQDESVGDFVRRHFGQEMVDRVAEPLLAGVYGGNANSLSVRAVLPRFAEMEQRDGSLIRAALNGLKKAAQAEPQPLFTSLRKGMQQMVDALAAAVPASSLRIQQPVNYIQRANAAWVVNTSDGNENFDAIFLAVPAPLAAALVSAFLPQAATRLKEIQYSSSAGVLLACGNLELPPGFGFLVPAAEKRKMMACTFVHKKFSYRVPEGSTLLRCFFSTARVPNLMQFSDEELLGFARQEIQEILGLEVKPAFTRVFRSPYGLPQYETGHLERMAEIEAQLKQNPGFYLIGNSLKGLGVPDCIRSGRVAVEELVKETAQSAGAVRSLQGT